MHWITTVEAHLVILSTVILNIGTTVVGLRTLHRRLNNHVNGEDES